MFLLEDVKRLLDVKSTEFDDLITDIVQAVQDEADEYMQLKHLEATGQTAYFDGGVATLYLEHANVSNVTVTEDGTALIDGTDYYLYPERGVIKHASATFAEGKRIIVVTYDAGYGDDDLPVSLRRKIVKQAAYEFRRRKDMGLSSVRYPDGSVEKYMIDEWLPDVEMELKRRRRISL